MFRVDAAERAVARTDERERREEDTAADQALDDLVARARADAAGVLVAAGYHQHKRGAWRRRRRSSMAGKGGAAVPVPVSPSAAVASSPDPPDWRPFVAIMDRWVRMLASKRADADDADTQLDVQRELDEVARDLAGPRPSPIEAQLATTATLAWFALRYAEAVAMSKADRSITQATFDLKRVEHANRRYLATLRTLAQVRKLARPGVQILNVGHNNQTNIVAGADPTDARLAG
jgi:hypothetical protein